jgi:hypothetical protein
MFEIPSVVSSDVPRSRQCDFTSETSSTFLISNIDSVWCWRNSNVTHTHSSHHTINFRRKMCIFLFSNNEEERCDVRSNIHACIDKLNKTNAENIVNWNVIKDSLFHPLIQYSHRNFLSTRKKTSLTICYTRLHSHYTIFLLKRRPEMRTVAKDERDNSSVNDQSNHDNEASTYTQLNVD